MNIADQWATISVLWGRDLSRFLRKPSRLIGAFMQPIIFWLMIGGGLTSTFKISGAESLNYEQYFFPGVVVMLVLFAANSATCIGSLGVIIVLFLLHVFNDTVSVAARSTQTSRTL